MPNIKTYGVTLHRNGQVSYLNQPVGTWQRIDVWKRDNLTDGKDANGNTIVHYIYKFLPTDSTQPITEYWLEDFYFRISKTIQQQQKCH